jgi:hypothetical protein
MIEDPVELLSLEVPCDRHAPGAVRRALSQFEPRGWGSGDVVLIASELVTNAVLRTRCLRAHVLRVKALLARDQLTISVHGPGLSDQATSRGPAGHADGGWSLRIVEQLAARWGAERNDGYRIWAQVAVPSASRG